MMPSARRHPTPQRKLLLFSLLLLLGQSVTPSLHAWTAPSDAGATLSASADGAWTAGHAHDAVRCPICQELARSSATQPQPFAPSSMTTGRALALPPRRTPTVFRLALSPSAPPRAPPAALAPLSA